MTPPLPPPLPSPVPVLDAINAYQKTALMKAAIDLDLFTAIDNGRRTAADLASACRIAERGARLLCDHLAILGFLAKSGDGYTLTPVAQAFLSKKSMAYLGSVTQFLLSPTVIDAFDRLTDAARKGGTAIPQDGTLAPEHDVWVDFARAMSPMMAMPARQLAETVLADRSGPISVLDVAAGHGLFGLAFAKQNPAAQVTALDWPNVVAVARENAAKMGVAERFQTIAGSAFDAPLGGPYDVILLPNFLHHFDPPTCVKLLQRLRPALKPGGVVATMEFVPNDDRVSPPGAAAFALVMLASTPAGDAYTFAEYEKMFRDAGFGQSQWKTFENVPHSIILTTPA